VYRVGTFTAGCFVAKVYSDDGREKQKKKRVKTVEIVKSGMRNGHSTSKALIHHITRWLQA
jgi:hypothetical protein